MFLKNRGCNNFGFLLLFKKEVNMRKIIALLLFCAMALFAATGPVSQYGQLVTGKNSSGKGQIYGSCLGVTDGAEVQVKGMSLYWSLLDNSVEYWNGDAIGNMVKNMKIQVIRAAMATGNEDWSDGKYKGYQSNPSQQKDLMNAVVQAAIDNDIYVIIDWHSHKANEQTESAKQFFSEMAQKWGKYDNVIFELFNEPENQDWNTVKNYANQIVPVIRQYSDNLILVGNPKWDQNPQMAIGNQVTGENIAYTMHYYAMSHNSSGDGSPGANALSAMKAGLSVFVSEWGTGSADGGGTPGESRNNTWQKYLDNHKLSWANWSASHISEGTAAFGGGSNRYNFSYTTSGNMVKGYLASNPTTYTKCGSSPQPTPQSSSSSQYVPPSSSSMPCEWTNTCGTTAIHETQDFNYAEIKEIFDMNGNLVNVMTSNGIYIIRKNGKISVIRKY